MDKDEVEKHRYEKRRIEAQEHQAKLERSAKRKEKAELGLPVIHRTRRAEIRDTPIKSI